MRRAGTGWIIVPMRGSRATLEQMAEAADLLADPARRPVFFHCVAGHHRTSLVHAAYRIRHEGWSAERAWREVAGLPWARPHADIGDRRLIEAFAARERRLNRPGEDSDDATSRDSKVGRAGVGGGPGPRAGLPGLEPGRGQLRDRPGGPGVSLRTDERGGDRADGPRPGDQDGREPAQGAPREGGVSRRAGGGAGGGGHAGRHRDVFVRVDVEGAGEDARGRDRHVPEADLAPLLARGGTDGAGLGLLGAAPARGIARLRPRSSRSATCSCRSRTVR